MKYVNWYNGLKVYSGHLKYETQGVADLIDNILKGIFDVNDSKVLWGFDVVFESSSNKFVVYPGVCVIVGSGGDGDGYNKYHVLSLDSNLYLDYQSDNGIFYIVGDYEYQDDVVNSEKKEIKLNISIDINTGHDIIFAEFTDDGSYNINITDRREFLDVKMNKLVNISDMVDSINSDVFNIKNMIGYSEIAVIDEGDDLDTINTAINNGYKIIVVKDYIHINGSINITQDDITFISYGEKKVIYQDAEDTPIFKITHNIRKFKVINLKLVLSVHNDKGVIEADDLVEEVIFDNNWFYTDYISNSQYGFNIINNKIMKLVLKYCKFDVRINELGGGLVIYEGNIDTITDAKNLYNAAYKIAVIGHEKVGSVVSLSGDDILIEFIDINTSGLSELDVDMNNKIPEGYEIAFFDILGRHNEGSSVSTITYRVGNYDGISNSLGGFPVKEMYYYKSDDNSDRHITIKFNDFSDKKVRLMIMYRKNIVN